MTDRQLYDLRYLAFALFYFVGGVVFVAGMVFAGILAYWSETTPEQAPCVCPEGTP